MKKLFKKGLIALTLMLGMTFATPQSANAGYRESITLEGQDGSTLIKSYYDRHEIIYLYDGNGNLSGAWILDENGYHRLA